MANLTKKNQFCLWRVSTLIAKIDENVDVFRPLEEFSSGFCCITGPRKAGVQFGCSKKEKVALFYSRLM